MGNNGMSWITGVYVKFWFLQSFLSWYDDNAMTLLAVHGINTVTRHILNPVICCHTEPLKRTMFNDEHDMSE